MNHYRLYASFSNLFTESLETQLLFGERLLCQDGNASYYAYSQWVYSRLGFWRPYPVDRVTERNLFSPLSDGDVRPNAVIKTRQAILEPWHIHLPYGSPLCIDRFGYVQLPQSILSSYPHADRVYCDVRHVRFLQEESCMRHLINDANQLLGYPYLWGGRCIHDSLVGASGVDCSGFVHILFQTHGWHVPRNAKDQYLDCIDVEEFTALPLGGLIFFQGEQESAISHVLLKNAANTVIHATKSSGHIVSFSTGRDIEFIGNRYFINNCSGRAFFGVPKKRRCSF